MSVCLLIGFLDGEVTDVVTSFMNSEEAEKHFSLGNVYSYSEEPQGMQWRVLQRSTRVRRQHTSEGFVGTWAVLLPINPEDVPELVRIIALVS